MNHDLEKWEKELFALEERKVKLNKEIKELTDKINMEA